MAINSQKPSQFLGRLCCSGSKHWPTFRWPAVLAIDHTYRLEGSAQHGCPLREDEVKVHACVKRRGLRTQHEIDNLVSFRVTLGCNMRYVNRMNCVVQRWEEVGRSRGLGPWTRRCLYIESAIAPWQSLRRTGLLSFFYGPWCLLSQSRDHRGHPEFIHKYDIA